MRVSELGEFGLIALLEREIGITPAFPRGARPGLLVDIGDDALVTAPRTGAGIWTTDTLVEGVHLLEGRSPWRKVGWKALAVNVSDIAAMGGQPDWALVTLCLPETFCVEDVLELYRGLREGANVFGVTVAGGDVVRAPVFSVTVALSGSVPVGPGGEVALLRRDAAKPGDAIAVTGTLGDAAAGLLALKAGDVKSDAEARLVAAQERPLPRIEAGRRAVAAGVRCGMDISDGLVQDLGHIVEMSQVSARIEAAKVPLSPDLRQVFHEEALDLALTGGEDYQLLLCAPRPLFERLIAEGLDLTIVGDIAAGPAEVGVVGPDGRVQTYGRGGWDHFREP
jgi:thiamine-monophosphate kinase